MTNDRSVLLLGEDNLMQRTVAMTMQLSGHKVRLVQDIFEAINLVKTIPASVHSLVLIGNGNQERLRTNLLALRNNRVTIRTILVGQTDRLDLPMMTDLTTCLVCCSNDELLTKLAEQATFGGAAAKCPLD